MRKCRWQPAIPPSSYKSASIIDQIDPNPGHFVQLKRQECEQCDRSESCCRKGCEIYEKALEVRDELGIDPCSYCDEYMMSRLGYQAVDSEAAMRTHIDSFPDSEALLNDCPF